MSKKTDKVVTASSGKPSASAEEHLPIRRVLVPVDFSQEAQGAVEYAAQLAKSMGAGVLLLHVIEQLAYAGEYATVLLDGPKMHKQCLEYLREIQAQLPGELHTEVAVREGVPFNEIVAASMEQSCDLIIMSTHGRTGLMHVLLGSTAERVVRHAVCPVLIVPNRQQPH